MGHAQRWLASAVTSTTLPVPVCHLLVAMGMAAARSTPVSLFKKCTWQYSDLD
uniref:Uncharacterized protein n=1 Tax=Oryza brachyantha TaxID=4533 RepID=J3LJ92_ORYBR